MPQQRTALGSYPTSTKTANVTITTFTFEILNTFLEIHFVAWINLVILPTYLPTKAGPLIASCTTFCINAFGINGGSEKMSPYYNQCNDTTWGSFFLFFWILVKILEREFSLKCYFTCFTYYLLYYLNSLLNRLTRSTGQKRCHLLHKSSKFSDLLFALFLLVAK